MDKINAIVKKLIMNVMILGLGILVSCTKAPDFITVTSPDGKIKLVVDLKDSVSYSIVHEGEVLVSPSALAMKFEGGRMLGVGEASYKVKIGSASELCRLIQNHCIRFKFSFETPCHTLIVNPKL